MEIWMTTVELSFKPSRHPKAFKEKRGGGTGLSRYRTSSPRTILEYTYIFETTFKVLK
jgi:hypothetical protein